MTARWRAPARSRSQARLALALGVGFVLAACNEADDKPLVQVEGVGEVAGFVYIDLNGSGDPDGDDEGVADWEVRLEQVGGGVLASAVTDEDGNFRFEEVPVGQVALSIDEDLLGDTVQFVGDPFEPVTVSRGEGRLLQPGVTFPMLNVAEARAAPAGKPLFSVGVALNRLSQEVRTLHVMDVQGDGSVIRVRDLVGVNVAVGDSVRVRGRSTREAGQPLLQFGAVFRLGISSATLDPVEASTATADRAAGGTLDGALVQVRDAAIVDVDDLDDQGIRVTVNDGSGPVEILVRPFLNQDPDDFDPATHTLVRARGLLVPRDDAGDTRWTLQPRSRSDYRVDELGAAPASGVRR